jgi:short subunit dehydrogenase-like uncharacterized protein
MADRAYDIVLFGATGFTGGLTAEYLAAHAPQEVTWAIAGRSLERLRAVRERLGREDLPLLEADASDPAALRRVAESARVVATTVGPYMLHGEALVGACAAAGTDYLDLCGEPEFVDQMWLRHHDEAQRSGARLVHACGFDSIPHDLGALFCVQQLPEGVPLTVEGFVRAAGTFSGGTYHSAVGAFGRLRQSRKVAGERRRREPRPEGRRVRGLTRPPHRDAIADGWVVPVPTIDPQIVLRSAAALDRYGPDFRYGHYIVTRRAASVGAMAAGAGTLAALAQIGPVRDLLLRAKSPGDGPSAERRARSWFTVRFAGRAQGAAEPVICEVRGGDPGYGETAKMLAESALCLAGDDLPQTAGQVTSAVAMGDVLIERLRAAGISFEVVGAPPARP